MPEARGKRQNKIPQKTVEHTVSIPSKVFDESLIKVVVSRNLSWPDPRKSG